MNIVQAYTFHMYFYSNVNVHFHLACDSFFHCLQWKWNLVFFFGFGYRYIHLLIASTNMNCMDRELEIKLIKIRKLSSRLNGNKIKENIKKIGVCRKQRWGDRIENYAKYPGFSKEIGTKRFCHSISIRITLIRFSILRVHMKKKIPSHQERRLQGERMFAKWQTQIKKK